MHSGRGRAHTNLRLIDEIRSVRYAEDTVQWTTATTEETGSQSDSSSDFINDSHRMTVLLTRRFRSVKWNTPSDYLDFHYVKVVG